VANRSDTELVIGEIVASSTGAYTAQCIEVPASESLRLIDPPEFGAIVKIASPETPAGKLQLEAPAEDEADPFLAPAGSTSGLTYRFQPGVVLGIVANTQMTSLDRRPTALGYATEEDLRMHQPQVFELISTEFSGLLIGYADETGRLRTRIPPVLPRIHSRVYRCTDNETAATTANVSYLRRVLDGSAAGPASEELCAAIIRHGWKARAESPDYLDDAGRQLSSAVGGDYDRLQRILRSVIS
jgi:hypothetical protein